MNRNRSVRIFLSSTFRDFEEERRILVQEVFYKLRTRLRERFVELVDIDLRWGIPAEEAERGQVLSICLEEIDQCRPYFIGLLGERYGWVPTPEGYPAQLAENHPWLTDHRGIASVTELEIRYGVLDNPEMRNRALFFFRDPAYAHGQGGEFLWSDSADSIRQSELKERIVQSGLPVYHYLRPQDLGLLMEEELWSLLDAEFPADTVPDDHELENLSHSSFAASKLGPRFVEKLTVSPGLPEALSHGHQRLLVTGPAGIGKSTLLAHWALADGQPEHIVFYHFLEAGDESTQAVNLLQRLFEMIRRQTACENFVPENRRSLLKATPEWLAIAHAYAERMKVRWTIVLDGLDRLDTEQGLLWLPTFIPESIQLIVSSRPGALQGALKRRGSWKVIEVNPLQAESKYALLHGQLVAFKKQLNEKQINAILDHPRSEQPLFLCTLTEELRLFGSFEGLQSQIDGLLSSADTDDLYEQILMRLEANNDPTAVRRALLAICLSDSGLTEEEVLEFSGLSYQGRWSPIRLALGDSLTNASGRVRPSHGHLRKAIRDRYYPNKKNERTLRLELAEWFGNRPLDRRSAWEQSTQLWMASEHQALLRLLSDHDTFEFIHLKGGSGRLNIFWQAIEAAVGVTPEAHYKDLWSQWQVELTLYRRIDMSVRVDKFLRFCGKGDDFLLQLAQQRLQDCLQAYGDSDIRYLRHAGSCAKTFALSRDHLDRASSLATIVCSSIELVADSQPNDLPTHLLILAGICLKQRNFEPGIVAARRSLLLQEELEGPEHPSLLSQLNCLTDLLLIKAGRASVGKGKSRMGNSHLAEAIDLQKRCLFILRRSRGLRHMETAACFVRTGRIFARCDEFAFAERAFKKAIEIRIRLVGDRHPLTLSASKLLVALPILSKPD
jgi:hypothetical protein